MLYWIQIEWAWRPHHTLDSLFQKLVNLSDIEHYYQLKIKFRRWFKHTVKERFNNLDSTYFYTSNFDSELHYNLFLRKPSVHHLGFVTSAHKIEIISHTTFRLIKKRRTFDLKSNLDSHLWMELEATLCYATAMFVRPVSTPSCLTIKEHKLQTYKPYC